MYWFIWIHQCLQDLGGLQHIRQILFSVMEMNKINIMPQISLNLIQMGQFIINHLWGHLGCQSFYIYPRNTMFGLQFYRTLTKMTKISIIAYFVLFVHIYALNEGPCPIPMTEGSVHTGKIQAALHGGVLPLQQAYDLQCYNYSLPYTFASVPQIAVAFHNFDIDPSNNIFFYVKPILTQNKASIAFVIRTQWFYTKWNELTFNFLAEDRSDLQSGYFQIDSGPLTSCHNGAIIQVSLPFKKHYHNTQGLINHVFLHGFQISTVTLNVYSPTQKLQSPFDLKLGQSVIQSTYMTVQISVSSATQVNSIYLSYIVYESSVNFQYRSGSFFYDVGIHNTLMFRPIGGNIKRSFAQIYGLTGFIFDLNSSKKFYLKTRWDGEAFQFDFGNNYNLVKYFSFQYMFFTGSECQSCPGYPLSTTNGTCVNSCPTGSFKAPSGNYCITCGPGMTWDGNSCILACPAGQYYNNATRSCQCPPTLKWNGNSCITCTGGKVWVPASKSCDCPVSLMWNGYTCAKLPDCRGGKIWDVYSYTCKCPDRMYEFEGVCKQIPVCQGGQVLNQMKRCVCPNNFIWNGRTCAYTPCFGGQIWTGSNCVCPTGKDFNGTMCIQCINGQKWDNNLRICSCQSGYQWNGQYCQKNYQCSGNRIWSTKFEQCICQDQFFWSGFACLPIPECRGGQIWDSTLLKCVCLSGQRWSGAQCILCTNGKIWNQYSFRCLCPPGTVETNLNGGTCEVQQQCSGGKMWMQNIWSCQCPSSTVWNGNYCLVNPCNNGRVWNEQFKACSCPPNKIWKNDACVPPQVSCSNGRQWNNGTYTCECPLRTYPVPNSCLPIPICLNGKIYNPLSNKCTCPWSLIDKGGICRQPECSKNQYWNGYECSIISCPPPSYFANNSCIYRNTHEKTLCSFGYIWNGYNCEFYPNTCPKGTNWNGNQCISIGICPRSNQFMNLDGKCQRFPRRCQPPTKWDGKACIYVSSSIGQSSKIVCPEGTYYSSNNKCLPMTPCQGGHIWDSVYLTCVCPPNMFSNGKKCVQCPKDKIWDTKEGCICPQGSFDIGLSCQNLSKVKCSIIQNSLWDNDKCICRPNFTKVGFQCICFGVQSGSLCDKCTYKQNSIYNQKKDICECRQGFIDIDGRCVPAGKIVAFDDQKKCSVSTYFDYSQRMCLQCPPGCLSCENSYACIVCKPEFTYDPKKQLCAEHCGDGRRFVLDCDDGNNQDGDGCSRDCRTEPGYTCLGGNPDRPDNCRSFIPGQITIELTGQIRMQTSIVLNVQLNYLPQALLQGSQCKNSCQNILNSKIVSGDQGALSITSRYISGTYYTFAITIQFGRPYIGQFSLNILINSYLTHRFFDGVNKMGTLTVDVNPIYLAQVTSTKNGDILS